MRVAKAHGLGNDFLLVREDDAPADPSAWATRLRPSASSVSLMETSISASIESLLGKCL